MHSQTAENNVDQNIIIFWSHIGARTVLPHIGKDIPILFALITENKKRQFIHIIMVLSSFTENDVGPEHCFQQLRHILPWIYLKFLHPIVVNNKKINSFTNVATLFYCLISLSPLYYKTLYHQLIAS